MKQQFLLFLLLSIACLHTKAQTWTSLSSGSSNSLLSLHFLDEQTGYVVGANGTILKTTDAGLNWAQQASGTSNAFYSTFFTSPQTGWAVGDFGTIRHTNDGGNSWNFVNTPVGFADLRVVWFLDPNIGFIGGGFSGSAATLIKTTDGGASWTDISPNNGQVVYGIFFTSPQTGYASDFDGNMLKTTNGGASWSVQSVSSNNLHGIYFTDANTGYVAGGNIGADAGVILKTSDAGNTWNQIFAYPSFLTDIKFFGPNKGYAVGGSVPNNIGLILKTTDAGNTWLPEPINLTSRQFRVFMPSAQFGYSCGLNGTILRTPEILPCVPELSTDLVAHFPFNGNTNDVSPTALNGIGYNLSPAVGHDGVPNSAYLFNGNSSWIDAGTDNRGVSAAVSVVAWVRTNQQDLGQWVLGKYRYEEDRGYVLGIGNGLNQNIGQVIFGGRDGTSGSGAGHLSGYSSKLVNDGQWHCLTGVAADNQWEVYVDGTLENSAPGSTIDMSTSLNVPLTIGFQIPASPVWMDGDIDDVRIYNRRLTACEIEELCNVVPSFVLPPPEGSTVACLSAAQQLPIPPAVSNTCGDPVTPTGPVISPDPFCSGEKTYTWTYMDCTGISLDWVYTYTITPPIFNLPVPDGSTVACLSAAQLVPIPPSILNSCGDPVLVTGPVISADPACSGEKTYTWTYTDCTGNAADWVYSYTIAIPSFNLPAAGGSNVGCVAASQAIPIPPLVNNSCGEPMTITGPVVSATPACSGEKTYTWTYMDCSGNTADWVYTYTIAPPSFSLPAPGGSTIDCIAGAQVVPTPPQVINSCDLSLIGVGPVVSADPVCSGIKTYTWAFTDCAGNTADWVYTYTINASGFSLPAPGSSTVACIAGAQLVPTPPVVNNSCGSQVAATGPVESANPSCSGTKTYTWTYMDCTGSSANWVYTYTISPPTFNLAAPAGSTVDCAGSQVVPVPPAVSSSCGNPITVSGPVVGGNTGCTGIKTYTWTYTDCAGNTADWVYTYTLLPEPACDVKTINCIKYELLSITKDAQNNHSYRIRITNNCAGKLSYVAAQLPNGVLAKTPFNDAIITAEGGHHYKVRNPNYSPFYSIRFSSQADSIFGGQSEVFEYKLPPQAAVPSYIHVMVRLEPQAFFETHLNTFGCDIMQSANRGDGDTEGLRTSAFAVYPNPNSGSFSLELPEAAVAGIGFRIVDITGKRMSTQEAVPGSVLQRLEASELAPGLYFLQMVFDGKVLAVEKFVKQ